MDVAVRTDQINWIQLLLLLPCPRTPVHASESIHNNGASLVAPPTISTLSTPLSGYTGRQARTVLDLFQV